MTTLRRACPILLAMLALTVAGCSSGGDTAAGPETDRPPAVGEQPMLDGVRFDVRRDPG
ncbi:MAG: hypothetical protein R2754_07600 [Microthrixaceae bacterium]